MKRPPLLVFGVGNPSRGDDAIGPMFLERLEAAIGPAIEAHEIEILTDFQLQIEHALDLVEREQVVFVDASVSLQAPYRYERVFPARERSYTTHALSPAALLETYRHILGEPPPSYVLAIRGERFELGEGLSGAAEEGLREALGFFLREALHRGLAAG